jgi:magnesium transporter
VAHGALEEDLTEDAAEDVENLLESYFAQIDAHYDKLRNVGEYIEDTEEYINIELDAGRNRLIRLDIVLTAASFALAPFNLMAGILGENLVIPPLLTASVNKFWVVNATALLL